jgi:hypothetical protein
MEVSTNVCRTAPSNKTTAMRFIVTFLAAGLGAVASFAANAATARTDIQSKELALATLAPDADPTTDPIAAIWKDQLSALRAQVASKSPKFLNATFVDGDRTLLFSVSIDDPSCVNLSGALAHASSFSSCPMRVAQTRGGVLNMVKSSPEFYFPDPRYVEIPGGKSTTVTFDPRTGQFSETEVVDGVASQTPDPSNPPVRISN